MAIEFVESTRASMCEVFEEVFYISVDDTIIRASEPWLGGKMYLAAA